MVSTFLAEAARRNAVKHSEIVLFKKEDGYAKAIDAVLDSHKFHVQLLAKMFGKPLKDVHKDVGLLSIPDTDKAPKEWNVFQAFAKHVKAKGIKASDHESPANSDSVLITELLDKDESELPCIWETVKQNPTDYPLWIEYCIARTTIASKHLSRPKQHARVKNYVEKTLEELRDKARFLESRFRVNVFIMALGPQALEVPNVVSDGESGRILRKALATTKIDLFKSLQTIDNLPTFDLEPEEALKEFEGSDSVRDIFGAALYETLFRPSNIRKLPEDQRNLFQATIERFFELHAIRGKWQTCLDFLYKWDVVFGRVDPSCNEVLYTEHGEKFTFPIDKRLGPQDLERVTGFRAPSKLSPEKMKKFIRSVVEGRTYLEYRPKPTPTRSEQDGAAPDLRRLDDSDSDGDDEQQTIDGFTAPRQRRNAASNDGGRISSNRAEEIRNVLGNSRGTNTRGPSAATDSFADFLSSMNRSRTSTVATPSGAPNPPRSSAPPAKRPASTNHDDGPARTRARKTTTQSRTTHSRTSATSSSASPESEEDDTPDNRPRPRPRATQKQGASTSLYTPASNSTGPTPSSSSGPSGSNPATLAAGTSQQPGSVAARRATAAIAQPNATLENSGRTPSVNHAAGSLPSQTKFPRAASSSVHGVCDMPTRVVPGHAAQLSNVASATLPPSRAWRATGLPTPLPPALGAPLPAPLPPAHAASLPTSSQTNNHVDH